MTELFKHQREGLEYAKEGCRAFFWECGTGKSCLGLNIVKHFKDKGLGPALVVCPLSIIESAWIEDCRKFTPQLSIVNLWDKKPANRKKKLAEDYDIYVANYETFKKLYDGIVAKDFAVLIVDESSKMKSPVSGITKSLLSLAGIGPAASKKYPTRKKPVPYRYVLSGTPAPNDELEYWAQIKFVTGPGNEVFHDNYYVFRSRYAASIPVGPVQKIWRFRSSMRSEFSQKLARVSHVVAKADAVDLPAQVHEIRHVRLCGDERRAYRTMAEQLVLRFAGEDVLASNALVELMKLRQLTSGFCYGDNGIYQTGTSKLAECGSLLEQIGDKQVIIWCSFKHEIGQLLKRLPSSAALWSGTPDREAVIEGFKAGQYQYLIAHPRSAAHGLTFTNCNYAVYFSLNYSYEDQKQSQDRIHRIGQKMPCTYYYLVATDTIDEVVHKALADKAKLSSRLLDYLREKKT